MKRQGVFPCRLAREQVGFTLFEALIAVALTGLILTTLAAVTAQWMPNWKAGFIRVQRTDLLGLGIERIVADLAAAEFISPNAAEKRPFFDGTSSSVTFIRSAIGPNASGGLEIVRLAESSDARGVALVRARAPYAPLGGGAPAPDGFADAITLVRAPYRISFAFAGHDRAWRDVWSNNARLPEAVRVIVRDAGTNQILADTTATLLHVTAPALCVSASSASGCVSALDQNGSPEPSGGNTAEKER